MTTARGAAASPATPGWGGRRTAAAESVTRRVYAGGVENPAEPVRRPRPAAHAAGAHERNPRSMTIRRTAGRALAAGAALSAVLALAACGDDDRAHHPRAHDAAAGPADDPDAAGARPRAGRLRPAARLAQPGAVRQLRVVRGDARPVARRQPRLLPERRLLVLRGPDPDRRLVPPGPDPARPRRHGRGRAPSSRGPRRGPAPGPARRDPARGASPRPGRSRTVQWRGDP